MSEARCLTIREETRISGQKNEVTDSILLCTGLIELFRHINGGLIRLHDLNLTSLLLYFLVGRAGHLEDLHHCIEHFHLLRRFL